jgi:hypothetical protein
MHVTFQACVCGGQEITLHKILHRKSVGKGAYERCKDRWENIKMNLGL